jgi:dihydrofolate reductase
MNGNLYVSMIVAMGRNHEIGRDNDLMWHLPVDMKFFKNTTLHHPVIMGRKNWDSIPLRFRPLSDRPNVVLTSQADYAAEGAVVVHSLEEAFQWCSANGFEKAFVIGGAQVYDLALQSGVVDEMYITRVDAEFADAHAFFPKFNEADWEEAVLGKHEADDKHAYSFEFCLLKKR